MLKHHIAVYGDKTIVMDYISNPKDEFKFACMRIIDNGFNGTVITPAGKTYAVNKETKKATLLKDVQGLEPFTVDMIKDAYNRCYGLQDCVTKNIDGWIDTLCRQTGLRTSYVTANQLLIRAIS